MGPVPCTFTLVCRYRWDFFKKTNIVLTDSIASERVLLANGEGIKRPKDQACFLRWNFLKGLITVYIYMYICLYVYTHIHSCIIIYLYTYIIGMWHGVGLYIYILPSYVGSIYKQWNKDPIIKQPVFQWKVSEGFSVAHVILERFRCKPKLELQNK